MSEELPLNLSLFGGGTTREADCQESLHQGARNTQRSQAQPTCERLFVVPAGHVGRGWRGNARGGRHLLRIGRESCRPETRFTPLSSTVCTPSREEEELASFNLGCFWGAAAPPLPS